MDPFEIEEALESFQIIADTREQNTPEARKRFARFGVPVLRATMNYGDYCGLIKTNGEPLHNLKTTISAPCVVERKMSLDELAGNLTRGRKRFQQEFERARKAGAHVYLLVENGSWEAIKMHRYRSQFHPKAFMASLTAWMVRYDICPIFCKTDTAPDLIREILYRDLKERLERGEYG